MKIENKRKRPAIFISIDSKFESHWEYFNASLAVNWPDHPDVLVALHDRNGALEEKIRATNRYTILDSDILKNSKSGPVMKHLEGKVNAEAFYARLILWSDIFQDYDTILHLDVDTLVLAPLDKLIQSDNFLIAEDLYEGSNYLFNDHTSDELNKLLSEDGISIPARQANAGVFCIPKRYRSKKSFLEIMHLLNRYKDHLRWADQSLINIWMLKNQIPIAESPVWNFQARRFYQTNFPFNSIKLLHFNGVPDPIRIDLMEAVLAVVKDNESWSAFIRMVFPCSDPNPNDLQRKLSLFRQGQSNLTVCQLREFIISLHPYTDGTRWIESEAA